MADLKKNSELDNFNIIKEKQVINIKTEKTPLSFWQLYCS